MREHKAWKRFGQNFLRDTRTISDIVNAVRPQPDGTVVEIGPGSAATTEPLTKKLNCLHVCEIDRDVVHRLKILLSADKLVIHEGGVLQFGFNSIEGKKKIVSDLPYNISTPFLFRLGEVMDDVTDMYSMLQKEVIECTVVQPKINDYDRPGAMPQYLFDMETLIEVPPGSLDPTPKVDSAVVRMIPVKYRTGKAGDFEHFAKLVKLAFHQCRKTIRNNLKELADDDDSQAVGINPQSRTEHIVAEKYVESSNYLVQKAA